MRINFYYAVKMTRLTPTFKNGAVVFIIPIARGVRNAGSVNENKSLFADEIWLARCPINVGYRFTARPTLLPRLLQIIQTDP